MALRCNSEQGSRFECDPESESAACRVGWQGTCGGGRAGRERQRGGGGGRGDAAALTQGEAHHWGWRREDQVDSEKVQVPSPGVCPLAPCALAAVEAT